MTTRTLAGVARLLPALLAVAAAGCGQSRTVPVEGQVVWADDGSPARELAGYEVTATVPGSASSSRGEVDQEGKFRMSTFEVGDGVEPGEHQVSLAPAPRTEIDPPLKATLPAKYARPGTSGLTFTAERGKPNAVTLSVARK